MKLFRINGKTKGAKQTNVAENIEQGFPILKDPLKKNKKSYGAL